MNREDLGKLHLAADLYQEHEEYWLRTLDGDTGRTTFFVPPYGKRGVQRADDNIPVNFGPEVGSFLLKLSNGSDLRLHMLLIAGVAILLHKYSGERDFLTGTSIYLQKQEADFVNVVLPLRHTVRPGMSFKDVVLAVRETIKEASLHQNYPVEIMLRKLKLPYSSGDDFPLFDVTVLLENVQDVSYMKGISTNFSFRFRRDGDRVTGELATPASVFSIEELKRLASHLQTLLAGFGPDIDRTVGSIDILDDGERQELWNRFCRLDVPYPRDDTVVDLFRRQVEDHPHRLAVMGDGQATYSALDHLAANVSRKLRVAGIQRDTIVALMAERSIEVIAAILGVLKAGGAYFPIDAQTPPDRLGMLLKDSAAPLVVTDRDVAPENVDAEWIPLADACDFHGSEPETCTEVDPGDLAYIIYTSGSTGIPKGVMIEHRNVVRLMSNDAFQFQFGVHDRWTMFHSYQFDFSVWEMYGPLLYGGSLVLVPRPATMDMAAYLDFLLRIQPTVLNQTPSVFYRLAEEYASRSGERLELRYIVFGGEALAPRRLAQWKRRHPGTRFVNMFGITETTVHVTFKELTLDDIDGGDSNIGTPLPTLAVYLMDGYLRLLPNAAAGEMMVGGDGVARGYLNRPELTQERFPVHPLRPGQRLYRSGDWARPLPNGELVYLGRSDQQVKIRGFRVELREIEAELESYSGIAETVVLAREDGEGDHCAAAYYTTRQPVDVAALRDYMAERLPLYMVPAHFVEVERIPVTVNGKVDRKALGLIQVDNREVNVAPRTETESALAHIWADLLDMQCDRVSVEANFFELGGHSLKATILSARIHKEFAVRISVAEIFQHATIAGLASLLDNRDTDRFVPIEPVRARPYYPLSSQQKRLFVLQRFENNLTAYNITSAFQLRGPLDAGKLETAFQRLVARHEALRTSFHMIEGEPCQKVADRVDFSLQLISATDGDYVDEPEAAAIVGGFAHTFDLTAAPLLRAGLIRLADDHHVLLMDIHHIVADGITMMVFMKEGMALYAGEALPDITLHYKDYVLWQQGGGDEINRQREFWLNQFRDIPPELALPLDFPRPAVQSFEGDSINFQVEGDNHQTLIRLAQQEDVTMYILLLTVYYVFLSKITGQERVVAGTPVAGRRHADIQCVAGLFVNTLALQGFPAGNKTFRQLLAQVRETTVQAFDNEDFPFEELVGQLALQRDVSRNPLFDVTFEYNAYDEKPAGVPDVYIPGLRMEPFNWKNRTLKFDMTLTAVEKHDCLRFSLGYCTALFTSHTAGLLRKYFEQVLAAVLGNHDIELKSVSLLSPDMEIRLLEILNGGGNFEGAGHSLWDLFSEQAVASADAAAVVCADRSRTYRELCSRVEGMAAFLRQKGVGPSSLVGISADYTIDTPAWLLAILRTGAGYVPLDFEYPAARLDFMMADSGMRLLVSGGKPLPEGVEFDGEVVGAFTKDMAGNVGDLRGIDVAAKRVAYCIYTSGSTGTAKGVLVKESGVVNYLSWACKTYVDGETCHWPLFTSLTFDLTVTSLYVPLLTGNTLFIYPQEGEGMPLERVVRDNRVQAMKVTPSHLKLMKRLAFIPSSLKKIVVGGEPLMVELAKAISGKYSHGVEIFNEYGPTEATVGCMIHRFDPQTDVRGQVSIGGPIANTAIYVTDAYGNLLPPGIAGEIRVAGAGLALGYLNNSAADEKAFVAAANGPMKRIYRTGDLGRITKNWLVEFLGRVDQQVKIKGYRVEPEEVETLLTAHPTVEDAVVEVRPDGAGERCLCAYVVGGAGCHEAQLRRHLEMSLPYYMIPDFFVRLKSMPMTLNGKVDRRALPLPGTATTGERVKPGTDLERRIAAIWETILGIPEVGVNESFFAAGGTSIDIVRAQHSLKKELELDIPVVKLFRYPTIQSLAGYIKQSRDKSESTPGGLSSQEEGRLEKETEAKERMRTRMRKRTQVREQE